MTITWILNKQGIRCGLDSSGSRYSVVAGSYEEGNETCGFIKDGELIEQLNYYHLLMKDCPLAFTPTNGTTA